ncbi:hypothetical protein [Streptomyces sp. CC208A]|uniref:hypothetical protein n=1 Tax=Streptomyces sp. CC208A TaxID=3044573 RepID=UPI0024A86453|nr:hypothetical protein [Streptomyces sp. CC208A]
MTHQTDADLRAAPLSGRLAQAARARRPLRAVGAASAVAAQDDFTRALKLIPTLGCVNGSDIVFQHARTL